MICTQTSIGLPSAGLVVRRPSLVRGRSSVSVYQSLHLRASSLCVSASSRVREHGLYPRRVYGGLEYKRCGPVFANGGKGNSDGGDEAFSFDSLKKAMGGLGKQPSIEEMLKKQMRDNEFAGEGGSGGPPRSGGDGSGGPEDGDFTSALDELLQVVMATLGFIFVYIMLIRGEELTRLVRDYVKYLVGGRPSARLERFIDDWKKFYDSITWIPPTEDWLERAIVATPTWWHRPTELLRQMRAPRKSYDDDGDDT